MVGKILVKQYGVLNSESLQEIERSVFFVGRADVSSKATWVAIEEIEIYLKGTNRRGATEGRTRARTH